MGEISFCVMVSVTAVMRDKRTHYFSSKMLNVSLQYQLNTAICRLPTADCELWTTNSSLLTSSRGHFHHKQRGV